MPVTVNLYYDDDSSEGWVIGKIFGKLVLLDGARPFFISEIEIEHTHQPGVINTVTHGATGCAARAADCGASSVLSMQHANTAL